MAAEINERATAAIEAWGLEDVRPMDGGEVALVLAAERNGRAVVCKLNPGDPALGREAAGLAAWADVCPELLATRDGEDTILMERLRPGTPLADNVGSVDAELRVIGGLVRRLHAEGPAGAERLEESALAAEWMEALGDADDRAELAGLLAGDSVVIHTDLHANNVLDGGDGDWRVIDPKPFRAAPEAEIWGLVDATGLDPATAAAEMRRRLAIYCEAAGLDGDIAHLWARLRARAEANLVTETSEWRRELTLVADALDD
jgi:streptomycin 6-kinase